MSRSWVLAVSAAVGLSVPLPAAPEQAQAPAAAPPPATGEIRDPADVAGTWSGTYLVERCTRVSGSGPSYCRFVLGVRRPIALTLHPEPASVGGSFSFLDATGRIGPTGTVDGLVTSSGHLELSAPIRVVDPVNPRNVTTVTDWSLTLSVDETVMTGRFVLDREFVGAFGPQVSREHCHFELRQSVREP